LQGSSNGESRQATNPWAEATGKGEWWGSDGVFGRGEKEGGGRGRGEERGRDISTGRSPTINSVKSIGAERADGHAGWVGWRHESHVHLERLLLVGSALSISVGRWDVAEDPPLSHLASPPA